MGGEEDDHGGGEEDGHEGREEDGHWEVVVQLATTLEPGLRLHSSGHPVSKSGRLERRGGGGMPD